MDAMILLAHGARSDDWAKPFREIRDLASASTPGTPVVLAWLELMQPDFGTACEQLAAAGATRIVACPLFLGAGSHVARDLPRLLEAARARWPAIAFESTPAIGENDAVVRAIAEACVQALRR